MSYYDVDNSSDDEIRDRLVPNWVNNSDLNKTTASFIKKNRFYLWAFGNNEERALSVQKKDNTIFSP